MGASQFITVAKGRTAEDAFRAAREEALYEDGHGGYTGTIAEKRGFVMIDDTGARHKERLTRSIAALKEVAREARAPGAFDPRALLRRVSGEAGVQLDAWALEGATKATFVKAVRGEIQRLTKVRARCRARMSGAELAELLLEIGDRRIDDKFGPAGCIDLAPKRKRDREFLFFGWASS